MPAFIQAMLDWFDARPELLWGMGIFSGVMFVGAFFLIPWIVVRIPPDYFSHKRPPQLPWQSMHPVLRIIALVLKNTLGAVLLVAGIVMLIAPGQGILSILIGLALLDIPGKRAMERWIIARPAVFKAANSLRARYGHPPLEHPHGHSASKESAGNSGSP